MTTGRQRWTSENITSLQHVLVIAAIVFFVVAALCFATRVVRSLHAQHDFVTDEVLAIGGAAAAIAASIMLFTTSFITMRTRKLSR
jgi:phosphatidylglycerophosphatase A